MAKLQTSDVLALHERLCSQGRDIMKNKNHDYTNGQSAFANFESSAAFGIDPIIGILLRMQDKMKRIETFARKGQLQVKGESVTDAILDTINYAVLIAGIIEERRLNAEVQGGTSVASETTTRAEVGREHAAGGYAPRMAGPAGRYPDYLLRPEE